MLAQELTSTQARVYIDAVQAYQAQLHAESVLDSYRGGMHWKTVSGTDYLYKTLDGRGNAKSLGRRSIETERLIEDFGRNKAQALERYQAIQERMKEHARFCIAAKINRVPRIATAVLRAFERAGVLGRNMAVVGTNALYAYEAAAGSRFDSEIMATTDMDVLWDARSRLSIAAGGRAVNIREEGILGLLRMADRSFEPLHEGGFRAVNKHGYMVDLIKAPPTPPWRDEPSRVGRSEPCAAEIPAARWLIASPKMSEVVIGDDGFPATMVVPDPRAFAVYKHWLSQQPDREPIKKRRDALQARAVAELTLRYLPQYAFDEGELRAFPAEVIQEAKRMFDAVSVDMGPQP